MVLTPALAVVAAAQSESFEMADANADGVLTQEEISAAFGADLVSRILDAEDANGDGILTRAEAEHALATGATTRGRTALVSESHRSLEGHAAPTQATL
jgi:hypothetical protein